MADFGSGHIYEFTPYGAQTTFTLGLDYEKALAYIYYVPENLPKWRCYEIVMKLAEDLWKSESLSYMASRISKPPPSATRHLSTAPGETRPRPALKQIFRRARKISSLRFWASHERLHPHYASTRRTNRCSFQVVAVD